MGSSSDSSGGKYRFIKDLVFDFVRKSSGQISYDEVTEEVRKQFPHSAWKETHWAWYKSQIVTGKYSDEFTDEVKSNLRLKWDYTKQMPEPPEGELFTWLPFFEEMLDVICKDHNKDSLCKITHDIYEKGGLVDTFAPDKSEGPLREIDPLTFIAYFNRNNTIANRIEFCRKAKEKLGIKSDVPTDFAGIATFNPLKTWFFPRAWARTNEMDILWKFAGELNERQVGNDSFVAVQKIKNIGLTKLTQIMAICKPDTYLPINDKMKVFAKHKGSISRRCVRDHIRKADDSIDAYHDIIEIIRSKFEGVRLAEISSQAHEYWVWVNSAEVEQGKRYWIATPGGDAEFWDKWRSEGVFTIGWVKIGNLRLLAGKKGIKKAIMQAYTPARQPIQQTKVCYDFLHEVSKGDYVLAKDGNSRIIGYGVITGEYEYRSAEEKQPNCRAVKWLKTGNWDVPTNNWDKTLTEITGDDLLRAYLKIIGAGEPTGPIIELIEKYTLADATKNLFVGNEAFEKIIGLLKHKHNIILQGAPGVGKTFIAKRLAYYLIGFKDEAKVEMIQFHQSYSYEDFIQGYRPDDNGGFSLQNGVFYDFCMKAQGDPESKYVFVIDEINRGNLSKIFGELMMLVESDKRGEEFAMPLTYAKTANARFYIPENIYFIGTMNTADRSLAMVDYALRRRFAFVVLQPHFTKRFKAFLVDRGISEKTIDLIHGKMTKLNDTIRNDSKNLGPGYCIGHSFFCPRGEIEDEKKWLGHILDHEIKPLIDEYWFDNEEKKSQIRQQLDS